MNRSIYILCLCIVVGAVGGCTSVQDAPVLGAPVAEWSYAPLARPEGRGGRSSVAGGLPLAHSGQGGQTQTIRGTGRFIDPAPSRSGEHTQEVREDGVKMSKANFPQEDGVTLNLVNLPIAQAAKIVMGDILSVNYVVDPKLDGKVTVHTAQPVKKSSAIELFQSALRVSGAAVVENGGLYKIVPLDQAPTSGQSISAGPSDEPSNQIGQNARVVQLRYVSAEDMKRVLEPIVPHAAVLRADQARNALTLSGTAQDIATLQDAIAMFDVNTMRGMSFALVPVKSSDADALAEDLRNVFGSEREGPMNGMIQFIGNKRLSAILVISSQGQYLSNAEAWIHRLDARAQGTEKQFYSYHVQNRPAKEMVAVLSSMFGADATNGKGNNVGPRYSKATVSSNPLESGGMPTTSPLGGSPNMGGAELWQPQRQRTVRQQRCGCRPGRHLAVASQRRFFGWFNF